MDFVTFEDYQQLFCISQFGFIWCFCQFRFKLDILSSTVTEVILCSFHCILSDYIILIQSNSDWLYQNLSILLLIGIWLFFLVITNTAAVNIIAHILENIFLLVMCLGMEL